jgi:serine phosphatase RsbU (regulator of sigma subunit)
MPKPRESRPFVGSERRRALILAGIYALLVIVLLIGGGLYVRTLIAQSFQTAGNLATTRALAYASLRYMLDEETGVRGYAATHNRLFLEPYNNALQPFGSTLGQLRSDVAALESPAALASVDDMRADNAEYLGTVATQLLHGTGQNTDAIERHGKTLVDRFRIDVSRIDTLLTQREQIVNREVQGSIDRIGLLTGGAVALVLLISLLYAVQQAGLAARIERERLRAAEQRREADVLRAAYTTEKRIADTLQEAFVQRPLPTHPTFRFSATYVPASEEAKVGGDWYDALELPGNRVLFAIGDVTGHGIEAAVTMNRVRQALISSALLDPSPAALLARVAKELYTAKAPLVTAVAGYADATTYEFVYATAGHPPPLLIEPGRPPRMLDCGSLPLGAMPDNEYQTFRIQSVPGAMLVLYTDGAIEHSRDVIEGETILLAAAAEAARLEPPDPATFIHNAVFSGREIGDDVAILTVGFAAEPAAGVRVSADRAQAAFQGRLGLAPAERRAAEANSRTAWWKRQFGNKVA